MNFTFFILLMAKLFGTPSEVPECQKFEENLYLYSALNDPQRVDGYIDSLTACGNDSPEALMTIGRYFYNRSDYSRTKQTFQRVLGLKDLTIEQKGQSHYYIGLAAYYDDENALAFQHFTQALKLDYQTTWTLNCLGLVTKQTGELDASFAYYQRAMELDPKYDLAVNNAGTTLEAMGNLLGGLNCYKRADSICGLSNPMYRSNITRAYRDLDMETLQRASARIGYELFPEDEATVYDMAVVLCDEESYSEARPMLHKLLSRKPITASDWFSIAHLYDELGMRDSAYYHYRLTLKIDPNKSGAIHNIGIIYKQYGMFEKAHEYYARAMELNPNSQYLYSSMIQVYTWQRDFENALVWCRKYCDKFGDQKTDCTLNTGYVLLQLKRYEEAIPWLEKQLILQPNDDRALNNLGRCYAQLEQTETAFSYFERALASYSLNSYVFHNRAALYYDLGEYEKACADLRRSIELEYTWIIDDKLEEMHKISCPEVNTNRTILINEYTGNERALIGQGFIQLNDSLQEKDLDFQLISQEPEVFNSLASSTNSIFDSFKVFPNPSTGQFKLAATETPETPLDIKVFDASSRLVGVYRLIAKDIHIDLTSEPKGIYVAIIMNNGSVLSTQKLVLVD